MMPEDRRERGKVRLRDGDVPLQPACTTQRRIEHVRSVGCTDNDDAF